MRAWLILVGGIGTANFAFSIASLCALEKARNGPIVVVMEHLKNITYSEIFIFLFAALFSGGIATLLALSIGKEFAKLISKVDYKKMAFSIIIFVSLFIFLTRIVGFFY